MERKFYIEMLFTNALSIFISDHDRTHYSIVP